MRLNDDQKTVAAMDVLVPKVLRLLNYGAHCLDCLQSNCLSVMIIPRFISYFFGFLCFCIVRKHDSGHCAFYLFFYLYLIECLIIHAFNL
jgi:hypothetical protein